MIVTVGVAVVDAETVWLVVSVSDGVFESDVDDENDTVGVGVCVGVVEKDGGTIVA